MRDMVEACIVVIKKQNEISDFTEYKVGTEGIYCRKKFFRKDKI